MVSLVHLLGFADELTHGGAALCVRLFAVAAATGERNAVVVVALRGLRRGS
jgi:hypothetical protein